MTDLPSGAVTFLFSDIEGSTRLVKALRDRYPEVLAAHQRLVRAAITGHHGHEVDTQGDSFFAVFSSAKQAVLCAVDAQRALARHDWPVGGQVKVRMGIHTGQAVPAGDNYTGLAVHRAARICAAGHGGQVLVSQATATILEDEEEDLGITLLDLGEQRLKDLDRPVRLYQLAAPGLPREFAELHTGATPTDHPSTPVTPTGSAQAVASRKVSDANISGTREQTQGFPEPHLRRWRKPLVLLAGVIGIAFGVASYEANLLQVLELDTVDARFAVRGSEKPPSNVVIVGIDDTTLNDLRSQWPFPRSWHARVIRRISADRPLAIAYDVQFSDRTVPKEDNALIHAIEGARGKVVLGTGSVSADGRGRTDVLGNDEVVRRVKAHVGNTAVPPDPGGVLRRIPYEVDGLKSFAVVAAEKALDQTITPSDMGGRSAWVDFYGPPGTIERAPHEIPFSKVLRGETPPGLFTGKVVIIGATAETLQDVHAAATSGDRLMSGPEFEANAISTALRGFPLQNSDGPMNIALIVLLGLVVPAANLRLRLTVALAAGVVASGAFAIAVQLAFNSGWVVPFVYPLTALAFAALAALGVSYGFAVIDARTAAFVPAELPAGAEVGGYRVERLLGRGGGGSVYLALDPVLKRQVALKVLNLGLVEDPRARRRFLHESQLAAALDHPNIIPIFRAGDEHGRLYIAMKYVRGTLAGLLRTDGPLEPGRSLAIVRQIATALDAAHASGLVHRDVSPANILLDDGTEHAYLADFGLTKHASVTSVVGRVGTPDYVSPEIIRGDPIDGRSDLYSLACVLYECLTGRPPFASTSEVAVIGGHLSRVSEPPSAIRPYLPMSLDGVLERALAKTPEDRYETCREFAAAADAALQTAGDPLSS